VSLTAYIRHCFVADVIEEDLQITYVNSSGLWIKVKHIREADGAFIQDGGKLRSLLNEKHTKMKYIYVYLSIYWLFNLERTAYKHSNKHNIFYIAA